MLFANDGNVEQALKDSIMKSVEERKTDMCETWDASTVMALPWGVKENVEPEYADAVNEYIKEVEGCEIALNLEIVAKLLKAGVKERKGQYILIYRYQLI